MDNQHIKSPLDNISELPNFKPFMKTLALISCSLAVVGLLMKVHGMHNGESLLITGMGTLTVVAFLLGRIFPNAPNDRMPAIWRFAMTLTGYSLAIVIIGVLFWLMHWPGWRNLLLIGGGALVLCAIVWLYYFLYIKKDQKNQIFNQ